MICRCGSIREAARRLHVDSSAVNRQLLNLEEELGAVLFDRLPAGLRLTEAGRLFEQHVSLVLRDAQLTLGKLAQWQQGQCGDVFIAAAESLNTSFLPPVLEHVALEYPQIKIHAFTQGSESIGQLVANGDVDIGAAFSIHEKQDLTCVASGVFRIGAVMAPDHPLAMSRQLRFNDCLDFGLIMPNPDLATYAVLEPLIQRASQAVRMVAHCGTIELIHQMAKRGTSIGFQTRIGLRPLCEAGQLVFVPLDPSEQAVARLGLYVRAGHSLAPTTKTLLCILRDHLERLQDEERQADLHR